MCAFLIAQGAPINQKGGESVATPLQWAAQRCHYYTVHLLLQHGADPLITDAQGYNTLHISTFNGNLLLLVLLLHQGIPVDVLDAFGHTGLMWSAYKGFPACVDLFLRWGASVHARDEAGFTALHWSLVKGNPGCVQKLLEYGADRFAKTTAGKTPASTAAELNTQGAWHKALKECGYDEDGNVEMPKFPGATYLLKDRRGFVTKFLFLWPLTIIWGMMFLLSTFPIYTGLPLALAAGYGLLWCAQGVLNYAPHDMRQFHKTPWLAGIFAASAFVVAANWLLVLLPATTWAARESSSCSAAASVSIMDVAAANDACAAGGNSHWLLNGAFAATLVMCCYFYAACMRGDPGFVPKMNGIAEQKAVIDELIAMWKFDESNFCTTCMIRTPLRSKHCRRCQRCVAKHDQWVLPEVSS
jgi:palmitoyltransferase ZDHHC13/17